MRNLRYVIYSLILTGGVFLSLPSGAQSYPSRPIRILTAEIGGGMDFVCRLVAQGMTQNLGQSVVVENYGGSGVPPADLTFKAPPDGYTVLNYGSAFWLAPFLKINSGWDPVRDFAPVTLATSSPNLVVVNTAVPIQSIAELIAFAKARPGELNYASGAAGTSNHLAAELFKSMAGVNLVRIAYKGTSAALNDVASGRVQVSFASAGSVAPIINSGRVKVLAVTSAQPSALAPGVPTVAASGLPGYESASLSGFFVRAGTPNSTVVILNREINRVLKLPDVKEKLFKTGAEVVASTPGELSASIKSEMARLGKVIEEVGIHAD